MKNYLILTLIVFIVVLSSFLYKDSKIRIFNNFPVSETNNMLINEKPLNIFLFFSVNNCPSCLSMIPILNSLPKDQFRVIGVVNNNELIDEEILRKKTKAKFELKSVKQFKQYIPYYWPSIMGVDRKGKIYFVLPAVPGESEYLEEFLQTFYYSFYERLKK
jgi:thiol-disulfide isomerase/thioredoxin